MRKIIAILCVAVFAFFVTGCKMEKAGDAFLIQDELHYMKDSRTGLCFAYCWVNKELAFATVPCEAIPPELLTVIK